MTAGRGQATPRMARAQPCSLMLDGSAAAERARAQRCARQASRSGAAANRGQEEAGGVPAEPQPGLVESLDRDEQASTVPRCLRELRPPPGCAGGVVLRATHEESRSRARLARVGSCLRAARARARRSSTCRGSARGKAAGVRGPQARSERGGEGHASICGRPLRSSPR
eukprot:365708-Chlamydomonas_euryale.AAC.10